MSNNYSNMITVKFARALQPKFEERKGKGYIEFGEENNYPEYLLTLFNESAKHGGIIRSKAKYIFGKGFENVSKTANTTGETFNSVLKKSILDDEIFGGYYLQIVWNLLGQIKEVYHIDYAKVRANKDCSEFQVKDKWEDSKEQPRKYTAFNPEQFKDNPVQILYVRQYNPNGQVYPTPPYFHGLNYIDADVQISRHILGNAKDGFVATTLINLNGGEPQEEQKAAVEKGIKKKFTGSEGDRVVIMFNKSKDNAAEILPLNNTMLTKEDFTNINNLVQQEIYACHGITSPMLFGIKTEGQLGGSSEIRDSYEIFNNTYVNERQQAHEETYSLLFKYVGIPDVPKITPVEPLGFSLANAELLKIMPREYFMDKLAVDQKYYALPSVESATHPAQTQPQQPDASAAMTVNSNLAAMTGRQFQQLERISRKFKSGKLTREQAAMMLRNSFGLTDDDISILLDSNSEDQQFATQEELDFELLEQFAQTGEDAAQYEVLSSRPAREVEYFAEVKQLDQLESDVVNLIKKDKRITPEVLAQTLKRDVKEINTVLKSLEKKKVLTASNAKSGTDTIIERTVTDIPVSAPKPSTVQIFLRYTYTGPEDSKNRPFCAKMLELSRTKVWSRADIETISQRLGYSVWDRRGGWFTQPDGEHRPYCRHQWTAITVTKKV